MDIQQLSVTELKALAFDIISQRDALTNNLAMVQQELTRRSQEAPAEDRAIEDKLIEETDGDTEEASR